VLPPSHAQAGAVITCSGGFGQGTLRVVRQGVGIEDYAAVDFEGIRGIWTLSSVTGGMDIDNPQYDTILVIGLIERTVFLEIDREGGLEEIGRIPGLIDSEETIALNEIQNTIVQVTTERVNVSSLGKTVSSYAAKISACQVTSKELLISSGASLTLLSLNCEILRQWTLSDEITCLYIYDDLIALGLWNSTVILISLSDNSMHTIESVLSAPARSVVLTNILPQLTLFIGSRDGCLTTYDLPSASQPSNKKVISLGTQPLGLFPVSSNSKQLIFAASDRPTLLHVASKGDRKKLQLSALSLRDVLYLAPLQHPSYPDSLVIATKEGFRIGKMNEMSRLQVRSVKMPNGELPRRIAHLECVVGVISLRIHLNVDGSERTEGYMRVWDEDSWQCIPVMCQI
jgi:DNA damage-binding protein 1